MKNKLIILAQFMNKFILISFGIMFFFSCKREDPGFIGPELVLPSANFKIINTFKIKNNSINFANDSNWFNTNFNERVSWTITI